MTATRSRFGVLLVLLLLALPQISVGATSNPPAPTPSANPDLDATCGLDLSLVIDRSGSIGSNNTKVQAAAQAFVDALVGTGSTVQVVSFSDRATAEPGAGSALGDLAFSDPATLAVPLFPSAGSTNWDDALEMVRRSPAGQAPLAVVITDGNPTKHLTTQPDGHGGSLGGDGAFTSAADLNAAVTEANLIRESGTHLFVVGVGAALSDATSKGRVAAISGPDELTFTGGEPDSPFGTADFTLVEDFALLETTVAKFVRELCGPSLNLTKKLQHADGTTTTATDADAATFTATVSPAASQWTSPAQAPGATATLTTDDGVANFVWEPSTPSSTSNVHLTEAARPGWTYNGLKCWRTDLDGNPAQLVVDAVGANAPGASKPAAVDLPPIGPYQAMNCEVYNREIRTATVSVDKVTTPAARPEAFSFSLAPGGGAALHTIPSLTDTGAPVAFPAVAPGTYDVTEAAHPLFTQTGASCDDLATPAAEQASPTGLVVGEASSWRCTFANALKDGTLTIVKDLQGAPSGTFSFTSTVPGHEAFTLSPTDDVDAAVSFTVPAGTYQVAEAGAPPYTTGASCSPGSTPAAIVVSPAATTTCTFTNTAPAPTISVTKDAGQSVIAEPGGSVPYTVSVQNTSIEPLTVTELTDAVGGQVLDLLTLPGSTCAALAAGPLAPGEQASCTFSGPVSGNAGDTVTDTVTATAEDEDGNEASDQATAEVRIEDVAPQLLVSKSTATPTIDEPGGPVTFDVDVTNLSQETVTLLAISDQVAGLDPEALPLHLTSGRISSTTCALVPIAAGATYSCSFTTTVAGGAGDLVVDTVRALAVDDDGSWVAEQDDASVTVIDVLPEIEVTKAASPTVLDEPGGTVTFTVTIENLTAEPVVIDSIDDAVDGAPAAPAGGTCADLLGTTLAGHASTSCTFQLAVTASAEAGPVGDIVTVAGHDDDDNTTDGSDGAVVGIRDVLPAIETTKSAAPTTVAEPGGPVTYTVTVANGSVEPVTITSMIDEVGDAGAVDLTELDGTCADLVGTSLDPGEDADCTFSLPVSGNAGDEVSDVVTTTVQDDEGNEVSDEATASVTVTDVLPSITVAKDTTTPVLAAPGGPASYTVTVENTAPEAVTITSIVDAVGGADLDVTQVADPVTATSCATGQVLSPAGTDGDTYTCTFTLALESLEATEVSDVVTVTVTDDEGNDAGDEDDATTVITAVADLAIDKAVSLAPTVGGPGAYTLTVTNLGPSTAEDVVVVDELPAALTATAATGEGWTCAITDEGKTVTCTLASLASGGSAQISLSVSVADPGTGVPIVNTGTVTSPTPDPDPDNNQDTVSSDAGRDPLPFVGEDPVERPPLAFSGAPTRSWMVLANILLLLGAALLLAEVTARRRQGSCS